MLLLAEKVIALIFEESERIEKNTTACTTSVLCLTTAPPFEVRKSGSTIDQASVTEDLQHRQRWAHQCFGATAVTLLRSRRGTFTAS